MYIYIYTHWSFFVLAQSLLRHDGATLPARWSPSKQIGMSSLSRIIGQGLLPEKAPKQRDVHSRNLTYQELPLEKGVSFSKPSLWVSMLVCRGVDKH